MSFYTYILPLYLTDALGDIYIDFLKKKSIENIEFHIQNYDLNIY